MLLTASPYRHLVYYTTGMANLKTKRKRKPDDSSHPLVTGEHEENWREFRLPSFGDIALRKLIFGYWRFGTKYLYHLEASSSLRLPNYVAQHRSRSKCLMKKLFVQAKVFFHKWTPASTEIGHRYLPTESHNVMISILPLYFRYPIFLTESFQKVPKPRPVSEAIYF